MISLRLSDEEYEVVAAAFRQHGARNLSEFARAAMLQLSGAPPGTANPLLGSLTDLARRVDLVYGEVQRVVALLMPRAQEQTGTGNDEIPDVHNGVQLSFDDAPDQRNE